MLHTQDIVEMNQISRLLAAGLNQAPAADQIPLEVRQALEQAKEQMENLPDVIADLNQAFDRFLTLADAIGRMGEVARLSGQIDDGESEELRAELEEEFINLAKVVALEAGRHYYAGPHLTVSSQAQAQSAEKILHYLDPVMDNLQGELDGQKSIIMEVLSETINFLGVIAQCYPKVDGLEHLGDLLSNVKQYRNNPEAFRVPGAMLH